MKRVASTVLGFVLLALGAAWAEESPGKTAPTADNAELAKLFEEDQADRHQQPIDWSVVSKRDEERRARVKQMLAAGEAKTSADRYHAAMVFQHGSGSDDYKLARDLAREAVALDPENADAKWLSAAAHDRYLHSIGKPQVYGTQFRRVGDGDWTLEPFDEDAVTDEERKALGVRTLAESLKRLEEMNLELQRARQPKQER